VLYAIAALNTSGLNDFSLAVFNSNRFNGTVSYAIIALLAFGAVCDNHSLGHNITPLHRFPPDLSSGVSDADHRMLINYTIDKSGCHVKKTLSVTGSSKYFAHAYNGLR
jgi:hypothetical protein